MTCDENNNSISSSSQLTYFYCTSSHSLDLFLCLPLSRSLSLPHWYTYVHILFFFITLWYHISKSGFETFLTISSPNVWHMPREISWEKEKSISRNSIFYTKKWTQITFCEKWVSVWVKERSIARPNKAKKKENNYKESLSFSTHTHKKNCTGTIITSIAQYRIVVNQNASDAC